MLPREVKKRDLITSKNKIGQMEMGGEITVRKRIHVNHLRMGNSDGDARVGPHSGRIQSHFRKVCFVKIGTNNTIPLKESWHSGIVPDSVEHGLDRQGTQGA